MSYTEGRDYTLSRESDEPGIQLNTNISTSPVPSENSKPRESETIEAWKAWEDDQRTNPIPVNPHAFAYGYNIAKNKYSQPVPSEQEKQDEMWEEIKEEFRTTIDGHVVEYFDSNRKLLRKELDNLKKELSKKFTITCK